MWAAGATEDPASCPHTETDTQGSSKTLVRHTCKACLKVVLELPRTEAAVRAGTAKEVPRAELPQFRDVGRAMHVRPQVTLNAREVDVVLGLLTRNAHAHLSRFSSISGAEFIGLLDDAIESILEPTETGCTEHRDRDHDKRHILRISHWSDIIIISESVRVKHVSLVCCCDPRVATRNLFGAFDSCVLFSLVFGGFLDLCEQRVLLAVGTCRARLLHTDYQS